MKYKEFVAWCNARACDGCWSSQTAMFCISIMSDVRSQRFWRREKRWRELEARYSIIVNVVKPIDKKIREMIYSES